MRELFRDFWYSDELGFFISLRGVPHWRELGEQMSSLLEGALSEMKQLEGGAIANPDENRMVGHYWLRSPELAPNREISQSIERTVSEVESFASSVLQGKILSASGQPFRNVLHLGIGGSGLGPQLLWDSLGRGESKLQFYFLDNADPDGLTDILSKIDLGETLLLVVSKSGKTKETLTALDEIIERYSDNSLQLNRNLVAITQPGSPLDQRSQRENWLRSFPIWEWVGGRTSIFSPVGLLPFALMGGDIEQFIRGGAQMDQLTRQRRDNPAIFLALTWYSQAFLEGKRSMVVLPYRERLALFPRYLQQLIMESLGKKFDRRGRIVHTGLTVYGNKGTTDQHSLLQQLLEGPDDFFVTFLYTSEGKGGAESYRELPKTLLSFLLGTRRALAKSGRVHLLLGAEQLSPLTLGALIALFERTVGFYASLLDINAYHQPGVELSKRAANDILKAWEELERELTEDQNIPFEVLRKKYSERLSPDELFMILRNGK